jgi:hypothetical protein
MQRRHFLSTALTTIIFAARASRADAQGPPRLDLRQTLSAYAEARQRGDLPAIEKFYDNSAAGKQLTTGLTAFGGRSIERNIFPSTAEFRWTVDSTSELDCGSDIVDVSFVDGLKTGRACFVMVQRDGRWVIREVRVASGPTMQQ